jgi:hypothetical protein
VFTVRPRRCRRRLGALAAVAVIALLVATPGVAGADAPTPWHIVDSPNLGSGHSHLQEVSCPSSTRCAAVGYTQDPATLNQRSLVASSNDGVWKLGAIPTRGTSNNSLWNVSCASSTRCVAVGYFQNVSIGYYQTLIASYDGRAWSLLSSPNRPNVDNYLLGVDCADATHCVAVGRSFDQTTQTSRNLVLSWSGSTWTIDKTPDRPGVSNLLADVSCGDATHCVTVGYTIHTPDNVIQTLVVARNGSTWKLQPSFNRPGASNVLRDVACTSATTCVAVGASDPGSGNFDEQSLIQTLSGGVWSLAPSPDRTGYDNHLWAVSCSNATNCVAAGESQNGDKARTLIQTLSGGTWRLTSPSPYRGGTFNYLYGLSCPSRRSCVAAGDYLNSSTQLFRTSILTNSP